MKEINLDGWKRRKHFDFFRRLDYPHVNVTAPVDVSAVKEFAAGRELSFFKCILYLVARAANTIPELRQRIRGESVVEHALVHPTYTFLTGDEVFSFTHVDYEEDAAAFFQATLKAEDRVRAAVVLEDEPGRDDYLFISSIPWINYTSISHPIHMHPVDSVPRITWGRYAPEGERWKMPLSIQAHHALVDGLHLGRFFKAVEGLLEKPEASLPGVS